MEFLISFKFHTDLKIIINNNYNNNNNEIRCLDYLVQFKYPILFGSFSFQLTIELMGKK